MSFCVIGSMFILLILILRKKYDPTFQCVLYKCKETEKSDLQSYSKGMCSGKCLSDGKMF